MDILTSQDYSSRDSFVEKQNGSFFANLQVAFGEVFVIAQVDEASTSRINADKTQMYADNIVDGCKMEERKLWVGRWCGS